jgi:hypothetical protein
VACPAIPQPWRPRACDWDTARFARTAMRELWLVTAVLRQMTSDWTWDASNLSRLPTIAWMRPGKRVELAGAAVTVGRAQ